jgi:hypothetical protein
MKQGIILSVLVTLIGLAACNSKESNDKYYCDSANPTEEIPWLKEIREDLMISAKMSGFQIIGYKYKGESVFYIDACYYCADDIKSVYDCNGNVICEFGGFAGLNTCPDFETEATDSTMLFDYVQH